MGMFTESASIRSAGKAERDISEPFDRPGEWRERRERQLSGALRLIESYEERELSEKSDLQAEIDALKKQIAVLQQSGKAAKKFKETVQNKDLASADADAAFSAPVDSVEDLG